MLTLLGSILGFVSSTFPDILRIFRDKADKKHELAILEMQMKREEQGHFNKMEAIVAQADIEEIKALQGNFYSGNKKVDGYAATVRPTLAYAIFFVVAWKLIDGSLSSTDEQLMAIFAGIISFYFGQRSMSKLRK